MAVSGNLTIINATPFTWARSFQHSWELPESVSPGDIIHLATDWSQTIHQADGVGGVTYSYSDLLGDQTAFQLQASDDFNSQIHVNLDSWSSLGKRSGSEVDLDFSNETSHPLILSGRSVPSLALDGPPADWMQQHLPAMGCLPLSRISMPASHNAGMSVLNGKTSFATKENTLTHFVSIAEQLNQGFRYFDIRPVIHGGDFFTGHYSDINIDMFGHDIGGFVGGNGQKLSEMIDQINTFLDKHNELVILDISHNFNTDDDFRPLNSDELDRLFNLFATLKHRWVSETPISDLSTLSLGSFISNGPAVLIIIDNVQANENVAIPPPLIDQGFYNDTQLSVFNSFSDTDNAKKMSKDQLAKMKAHPRTPDAAAMFLLSWTLTTILDIRQFSRWAHEVLFTDLWPALSRDVFPNFIMIDGLGIKGSPIGTANVAALSVAITRHFNDECGN